MDFFSRLRKKVKKENKKMRFGGGTYEGEVKNGSPNGNGKLVYDNGDIYEGQWKEGEIKGKGKRIYRNGNIYEGEWKNNLPNGKGKKIYADGNTYEGQWKIGVRSGYGKYINKAQKNTYEGEWTKDLREGKGKITYEDGRIEEGTFIKGKLATKEKFVDVDIIKENKKMRYRQGSYEGEINNGLPHGIGKIIYDSGNIYEGEWKEGKITGKGKKVYKKTAIYGGKVIYEGEWNNYMPNGKGKQIYEGGNIYEGEWKNGVRSGYGKYINKAEKNTYEGEWSNDLREGKGKITYEDGRIEEGIFMKGKLARKEKIVNSVVINESKKIRYGRGSYEGEIKNGEPHGIGKIIYDNGNIYEGEWKEGKIIGKGKKVYKNTAIYEGEWNNYMPNGKGKKIYADGNIYEGEWKNGARSGYGKYINKAEKNTYEGEWSNDLREGKGKITFEDGRIEVVVFKRDKIIQRNVKDEKLLKEYIKNNSKSDNKNYCIKSLPKENDAIVSKKYGKLNLKKKIGDGGEGIIYTTNNNMICKVYKKEKLNAGKYNKIKVMIEKNIKLEGVCWPIDIICNTNNEFIGYIMNKANGVELQKSVFIKPLLNKNFPNWKRVDLVELTITILEMINELHKNNIIIGDINPLNILVKSSKEVYFVDTDSYQVDNIPCPVGTVNFTAPEIQGKDYKEFLRSYGNEYFSVATLVFMLMLPGKPPYSQQGGSNPYVNIKNMDFSYPYAGNNNNKTPEGPWKTMWINLPDYIKKYFYESFKIYGRFSQENSRLSTQQWIDIMKMYRLDLNNKMFNDNNMYEIFPR